MTLPLLEFSLLRAYLSFLVVTSVAGRRILVLAWIPAFACKPAVAGIPAFADLFMLSFLLLLASLVLLATLQLLVSY